MEQFQRYQSDRPTMTRRREDNRNFTGKPNNKINTKGKQRNLDPHERRLAVACRNNMTVHIERVSVDSVVSGKVVEFGKFDIVIRRECGSEICLFKSDLSSLVVEGYVHQPMNRVQ